MYKFLPDWTKPSLLTLVYPVGLHSNHERTSRETVLPLFMHLLDLINEHNKGLEVQIIFQPNVFNTEVPYEIKKRYSDLNILIESFVLSDLWIRDWAPIPVKTYDSQEDNVLLKAKYAPSYTYSYPINDDLAGKKLQLNLSKSLESLGIKWDFGNITTNGKDVIVTEQLMRENHLTKVGLETYLRKYFIFNQLVIIPIEAYDNVGHTDSVCRFLTEDTLILPSYPDYFVDECKYIQEIYLQCKAEFKTKYNYIFVDSDLSEVINKEGIYSAEGCYINYLRLGDNLYLPQYGLNQDKEAVRILRKRTKLNIIPTAGCSPLAFLGGVLNCYSWVSFD